MRRASQILEQQILVGLLRVRFGERARPRAIHYDRHAVLAIEARVGVKGYADRGYVRPERTSGMFLDRTEQLLVARQRLQRVGAQQAPDLDANAVVTRRGALDQRPQAPPH